MHGWRDKQVAKVNWSFLWEAFAIASGTPPSVWRSVRDQRPATAQSEANMLELTLKEDHLTFLGLPLDDHVSGRSAR